MAKKKLGIRKTDELINNLDLDSVLNDKVRQVRWLYNNSNKCTKVYEEKLVKIMIHRLQERIKELEAMIKEQNNKKENKALHIADIRQRFLSLCQKQADWDSYDKPTEETEFYRVCHDGLDFVELIMNCEKEFNIKISETGKDEHSFDKVKDFINWASLNIT